MEIPRELRYTREDEWIRIEGERLVVGVTDYAQQQLGDVVFLELPDVGTNVERGEAFGVIESVKAVADLFGPVTGRVAEVNNLLTDQPELVNSDCYGDGWMLVIEPDDPAEIETLLNASAYQQHVKERAE
ncbi:MAG: glycine cleavage system protein GcvH [Myxococcota bacterium]